jgi:aspartyl-tRNA(Asn)/glutamyl-tRNA(Gln) amidotransferase subunit A
MWTVAQLGADLAAGRTSSRELVEQALARIADRAGEGARAFVHVDAGGARLEADFADRLRKAGVRRSAVDGLPVSVKDLFDVAGQVTRAGSKILEDVPRKVDAVAVARLRAAGAVLVGRTNMVEFAFGGVGLNPHYGTPRNPWERKTGRVPGGSSSGAAVAQADGMCVMALGTDTGGSVRIPSALCGLAGFKPTARRVPLAGAFALSFTLDSIGPLANSIGCCAAYDAVLSGETPPETETALSARGLRLLVPRGALLEDLDAEVGRSFGAALERLRRAGALIDERPAPVFDRRSEYFNRGGFAAAEAYHIHRPHLERLGKCDPRVSARIQLGKDFPAADYVALREVREAAIREYEALAAPVDAIALPTTPCVAPTIAEADASDEAYARWNLRLLRNPAFINFVDGCAATLPCHEPGAAPVGLMLCGPAMSDRRLLAVAAAVERALSRD